MATTAFSPQGTLFEREEPADSGTFEVIGSLRNLTRANREVADVNVTSHDSEDGEEEFRPGLKNPGAWNAELFFDVSGGHSAVQNRCEADFDNRAVVNLRIQIRDETGVTQAYRTGKGYWKTLGETYPSDGTMAMRPVSVKATGPWPLTPGAP